MFYAPMGRFQLELIYYFTYFHRRPIQRCVFHFCRSFVINMTFSTGLVGVEVSSSLLYVPELRINLVFYLFFTVVPSNVVYFFPVGLSSLKWHFQQVLWVLKFLLSPGLGSWQLEFKSLIIVIVGFQNVVCCLAWTADLGVQITDEGRSLYIGSFCPAMISLGR